MTALASPLLPETELAAVSATALTRTYGEGGSAVHALRGVSIEVPQGQFAAVMGPSGSGKSTLMHLLAGLDTPDAGAVHIAGEDITRMSDRELTRLRRKHIGFVFQSFNLLPTLSAEENVLLPLAIAGRKPEPRRRRRADGEHGPRRAPRPQARAALRRPAAARRRRPRADLHADRAVRRRADRQPRLAAGAGVLELLRTAVDEDGQTTVMVTHDARAAATADRVLFLADGRVVADLDGPTEERDPQRDEGRGAGMIRVALKGLAARPVRTALTTLAIVVGVAFVCAAYTLTDTMSGAADTLTHAAYDGTDAVVVTKTAFRGSQTADVRAQAPTISAGALERVRHAHGVALAVGDITDTAQIIGTDGKPVGTGPYFGVGFDAQTPGRRAADAVPAARRARGRPAPARS